VARISRQRLSCELDVLSLNPSVDLFSSDDDLNRPLIPGHAWPNTITYDHTRSGYQCIRTGHQKVALNSELPAVRKKCHFLPRRRIVLRTLNRQPIRCPVCDSTSVGRDQHERLRDVRRINTFDYHDKSWSFTCFLVALGKWAGY
jgi:hypothetical protein